MASRPPSQLRGPIVLVAYVLSALAGLTVASVGTMVSAIWPPTGVALAALLARGAPVLPWIWLGSLVVNLTVAVNAGTLTSSALWMATAIASTNTIGPFLVWRLLRGWKARVVMVTFRDVGLFYLASALGACVTTAGGVLAMVAAGALDPTRVGQAVATWLTGDLLGFIVVAPALTFLVSDRMAWRAGRTPLMVSLAAALVFGVDPLGVDRFVDVSWLALVPLVWLGAECGAGGVAIGFIGVAFVFLIAAMLGHGPVVASSTTDPYLAIALWLGFGSVVAYSAGVVTSRWRAATEEARTTGHRLQRLVAGLPAAAVQVDRRGMVFLNPPAAPPPG